MKMRMVGTMILLLAQSIVASADSAKGLAAFNDGDYGAAMAEFRPLAGSGESEAQYYVGVMYHQG